MNIRHIALVLSSFIIFCCLLAGCDRVTDDFHDDRMVEIVFSNRTLSASLLKSNVTGDEDAVDEVILVGLDESDNVVGDTIVLTGQQLINSLNGGTVRAISRKATSIYAIANASDGLKTTLAAAENLSDLLALTADFSTAPEPSFLMSGNGEVDVGESKLHIQLIRTVAKIEFVGNNGLQITSVQAVSTPDLGYVFAQGTPGSASLTFYASNSNSVTLYVAENDDEQNPTQFKVTGTFGGKTTEHTFVLKKNNSTIAIQRNYRYSIGVSHASNISVDIQKWDDVVADDYVVKKPKPGIPDYNNGIKILAIGNSFSEDAMRYMVNMLVQLLGVNQSNITLVCAYIGGGSLQDHVDNILYGESISPPDDKHTGYRELRFSSNGLVNYSNNSARRIRDLIKLEWDIITLQQESRRSGQPDEYESYLGSLVQYVQNNAPPGYRLGWHMTWAFHTGHASLPTYYSGSQLIMYNAICTTVQNVVKPYSAFDFIIPSGTAIQNAREYFGDYLTRDTSSHLNELGCFIAGAMWVKTITGLDISGLNNPFQTYQTTSEVSVPSIQIGGADFDAAVKAVNDAHNTHFAITPP